MPDYAEAAEQAGWKQVGSKWVHPKNTKVYYNAVEVYRNEVPSDKKRPDSITPPERKPEPVATQTERLPDPEAPVETPKPVSAPRKKHGREEAR